MKKTQKPGPGRPKDMRKKSEILKAAANLFMKKGFSETTMDDIADAAHVSKLTIYNHFATKENLFVEVIHRKCDQFTGEILFENLDGKEPETELLVIGNAFMKLIFSPEGIGIHRLMISDGLSNANLGAMFYQAGPQRLYDRFVKYLSKLEKNTAFVFHDKNQAATLFFDLFKGDYHMRLLLNMPPKPTAKELKAFAKERVQFFMRAHQVKPF